MERDGIVRGANSIRMSLINDAKNTIEFAAASNLNLRQFFTFFLSLSHRKKFECFCWAYTQVSFGIAIALLLATFESGNLSVSMEKKTASNSRHITVK